MSVITMQMMRQINLLDRVARVKTTSCFVYNGTIFFAVPRYKISQAIGPDARNVRELQEALGKRVKIIGEPEGAGSVESFIRDVIEPVAFKSAEVNGNDVIINAGGTQRKAFLFGRNKQRYEELKRIIFDSFGKDLKII